MPVRARLFGYGFKGRDSVLNRIEGLERFVFINRDCRIVYFSIPKNACTTVRSCLRLGVGEELEEVRRDPHARDYTGAWVSLNQVSGARGLRDFVRSRGTFTFVVTRDPYSRVLSAYLNKLAMGNANAGEASEQALERYRLRARSYVRCLGIGQSSLSDDECDSFLKALTFEKFLRLVHKQRPWEMDGHWRIQSAFVPYELSENITYFRLDEVTGLLAHLDDLLPKKNPSEAGAWGSKHRTEAASMADTYYTPEAERLVREIYREDFRRFGYSDVRGAR